MLLNFAFIADPDPNPAFHSNADPDLDSKNNADPVPPYHKTPMMVSLLWLGDVAVTLVAGLLGPATWLHSHTSVLHKQRVWSRLLPALLPSARYFELRSHTLVLHKRRVWSRLLPALLPCARYDDFRSTLQ
jgi:hypothetical protein